MRRGFWANAIAVGIVVALVALIVRANRLERRFARLDSVATNGVGAPTLSRKGLAHTIERTRTELRRDPTNTRAAVSLADALLRQARVSGNAGLALEAERALTQVLHEEPLAYEARRMLGAVYLSEHRFRDAIREAQRAREQRPSDDWNYGVLGDGQLELGDYDQAFNAFQRMMDLRPTAGAYARAAYALELQGKLKAALRAMQLSTDATPPNDLEALAWHHAQLGDLYRQLGQLHDATFEFAWANHIFPDHPFAVLGIARMKEATGDRAGALQAYEALMARAPSPDIAERLGDLYRTLGRPGDAARQYALAETGWRIDVPQPAILARFLAEHDRHLDEAVRLAELTAADRQDIFTEDALAWAYFKVGRLDDAAAAMRHALRTGTKDSTIRAHATAIEHASRVP